MIRHLFMADFKDGTSEEVKNKAIEDMRAMKEKIPCIAELCVNRTTGWAGAGDRIMLTVDVATKEDFEAYLNHPYHAGYIAKSGGDYCRPGSIIMGQIEF